MGVLLMALRRSGSADLASLMPAVALALAFVIAHLWLRRHRPNADQTLLPIAALLTSLGLIFISRIEPTLAPRQAMWLCVGLVAWGAVIAFPQPVRWLARYRYSIALAGLALSASTLALGVDPNASGVRIWLGYGGYYFQPSELLKVMLVIWLAAYLEETRELLGAQEPGEGAQWRPSIAHMAPIALIAGLCLALLLIQRDLGPALLFFAATLAMLYVATGRLLYVLAGAATFAVFAWIGYRAIAIARLRFDIWLDPWTDAAGRGYQIVQGLVAVATGGLVGTGFGYGHPEILPAAHTDFPFAVAAEEMGLFGAAALLGLFALLTVRGLGAALGGADTFARLLAAGLTAVVAIQTLIIVAGNLRLIPLTGITLPFVSYGGSSLVTNYLILALLLRVSAETNVTADRTLT